MIILAYITFVTVYEQILSQNNGFFNVIIYGVVLILIFIFITLFLRVIRIKNETSESSVVLNVLITVGIVAVFALFAVFRLRYTSSISPQESYIYKTATYIQDGLLTQALDTHEHLIGYPADFSYGFLLSNIFGFLGADSGIYIIVNIVMMIIATVFLFATVNLISTKANATLAALAFMFMPNNSFLVYVYNSELFVTAVFMITVFLFELLIYKRFKNDSIPRILALICGIFAGFTISSEPVIILGLIVLTAWLYSSKRQSAACCIIPIAFAIVEFILLAFLQSVMMAVSFGKVLIGRLLCFVPTHLRETSDDAFNLTAMFKALTDRFNNPSTYLTDTSYFLTNEKGRSVSASQTLTLSIIDQFIYLFMLILCVLCIVYIIRVSYDKIVPSLSLMIALFLGQVLGGSNAVTHTYFFATVVLIGSTTLYYMFLNHHPDYAVFITNEAIRAEKALLDSEEDDDENGEIAEEDKITEGSEEMIRARALVFLGEDEELYRQIKAEEKQNRADNAIAATRIKTVINEEGEYDSVEENVEFLDEPDEIKEVKKVHEVKAIPATRPVEVVKPILADEYLEGNDTSYDDEEVESSPVQIKVATPIMNSEPVVDQEPVVPAPVVQEEVSAPVIQEPEPVAPAPVEGFVFRKKEDKPVEIDKKQAKINAKAASKVKEKPEKIKDKQDKKLKKDKKLADVKPGEPLPNPLKGPKPPKKDKIGFDFDSGDNDDFDF